MSYEEIDQIRSSVGEVAGACCGAGGQRAFGASVLRRARDSCGVGVGTDLPEPEARWHLYEGGSSGDPYPDLDRFNRVTHSRWTGYKGTGTRDFYDVEIGWDEASNITSVIDNVHRSAAGGGGNRIFDVDYTLDGRHRLERAEEGELDELGGSIQGTATRNEEWTLSQTGNWNKRLLEIETSTILDETNTFNRANELLERDINSNSTPDFVLAYNKIGQMTDDGDYEFEYDGFGRMRFVLLDEEVIVEHRYNGLGFRIAERGRDEGEMGPWKYFAYDENWRIVAVYEDQESDDPDKVYVHHAAGLDGYGGSSYIDSLILRDRRVGEEEVRGERRYYCNNWRSEPSAILTEDGKMVEWIKYTAYGEPIALPAGDTDGDFAWDATDETNILGGGGYDVRKDTTLDGTVGAADVTHANSITGGYQTLGRGVLSSTGVQNRIGYAGYKYDPHLAGADRHLYHVRHRVFMAHIGRWMTRDPLGYVDGMSLYEYVRSSPLIRTDPSGLSAQDCSRAVDQFWINQRCEVREVPGQPPIQVPGLPQNQDPLPYRYIHCDPADPCEQPARSAGHACCAAGGNMVDCIAESLWSFEYCKAGYPQTPVDPEPRRRKDDRPWDIEMENWWLVAFAGFECFGDLTGNELRSVERCHDVCEKCFEDKKLSYEICATCCMGAHGNAEAFILCVAPLIWRQMPPEWRDYIRPQPKTPLPDLESPLPEIPGGCGYM